MDLGGRWGKGVSFATPAKRNLALRRGGAEYGPNIPRRASCAEQSGANTDTGQAGGRSEKGRTKKKKKPAF